MTDKYHGKQRAAALTNFPAPLERGDAPRSKLTAVSSELLPSKQRTWIPLRVPFASAYSYLQTIWRN